MRKYVLIVGFLALCGTAQAQVRNPYTWTGFYLGADAGYAWGNASTHDDIKDWCSPGDTACIAKFVGPFNFNPQGAFGGGLAGYLFQYQNFVVGPEAEFGYLNLQGNRRTDSSNPTKFQELNVDGGMYAVLGGRIGYAFGRTLVYGKAGWAWYDTDATQTTTNPGYVTHGTGAFDGWAYGGGLEQAIGNGWSIRAEYLHFDLGTKMGDQTSVSDPPIGHVYANWTSINADSVKLGITYRFGEERYPGPLK